MAVLVECRLGHTVVLPCNWVQEGSCGEDARKCIIVKTVKE